MERSSTSAWKVCSVTSTTHRLRAGAAAGGAAGWRGRARPRNGPSPRRGRPRRPWPRAAAGPPDGIGRDTPHPGTGPPHAWNGPASRPVVRHRSRTSASSAGRVSIGKCPPGSSTTSAPGSRPPAGRPGSTTRSPAQTTATVRTPGHARSGVTSRPIVQACAAARPRPPRRPPRTTPGRRRGRARVGRIGRPRRGAVLVARLTATEPVDHQAGVLAHLVVERRARLRHQRGDEHHRRHPAGSQPVGHDRHRQPAQRVADQHHRFPAGPERGEHGVRVVLRPEPCSADGRSGASTRNPRRARSQTTGAQQEPWCQAPWTRTNRLSRRGVRAHRPPGRRRAAPARPARPSP